MHPGKVIASYQKLRQQAFWRLLAATNASIIIGILQNQLYEKDRVLPSSILHERIHRELEQLRSAGFDLPQTAQMYVADWLAQGYLQRRFPATASEEEYELSTQTIDVIRFLSSLVKPHTTATESRLALVINSLVQLANDTDDDKQHRIERLQEEKERIEQEIAAVSKGHITVLEKTSALERIREIIMLANGLTGDFRQVRDRFEALNRDLRQQIMENEGNRGEVLDALFSGIDLITYSEQGRTFSAFWRLLTDPEQYSTLHEAINTIITRDFIAELDNKQRSFLSKLTSTLLERGGTVHEVMQNFARSLKTFVQSKAYLEQRRLNQLLKEAMQVGLSVRENISNVKTLASLTLSSSSIKSLSQWTLHDPSLQAKPENMQAGEVANIDLETLSDMISGSEIDFRSLKINVIAVLQQQDQATIAEILHYYPATQGLGSIVGLVSLATRHGYLSEQQEYITWTGKHDITYHAYIPKLYFTKERTREFS